MRNSLKLFIATLISMVVVGLGMASNAQAQISLEGTVKLGGMSSMLQKERYGDAIFEVAGGLNAAVIFRFEEGYGIGLNFNWITAGHRLEKTPLTDKLDKREMRVHHPSFGMTLRYNPLPIVDIGAWLNYGFGTAEMNFSPRIEELQGKESFEWQLQSVDIGVLGQFYWRVKPTHLYTIFGGQVFYSYSRMFSKGRSEYGDSKMHSAGFMLTVGARYDFYIDAFGASAPTDDE